MHVQTDPILLLLQPLLGQPQIIADIILREVPLRLGLVIVLGGREEGFLEMFTVDLDMRLVLLAAVLLLVLETEVDWGTMGNYQCAVLGLCNRESTASPMLSTIDLIIPPSICSPFR